MAGWSSALPPDARAIVEPMPVATNQGGRARRGQWRVRFAPRVPPFVDPLTGWTGGCDPLIQIELHFPDRASAERYCRRERLRFTVQGAESSSTLRR
ncbi:NADH dehydrogenase ubiquinone Fe-S protein 4 [Sphingomonas sp. AP4-R1]|uniref:NADH dehydrogenase ubiquinone Fe-S protein 4 n=1 Tax=Sphingomonas sp. AP4-R1 TaxID=2735134 RepID=UPI0020A4830D|nr:NADH dehydrogenase ubiquinone Fe-S protein 4 [Sphingomonas sp. AP4-R1]